MLDVAGTKKSRGFGGAGKSHLMHAWRLCATTGITLHGASEKQMLWRSQIAAEKEVYQREVIFANMIDRIAVSRMSKYPIHYILRWKDACLEAYENIPIDESIENEMLLDDFFS